MEAHDYAQLENLSDRELYDFVTEKDSSQRKWVAIHLLEDRRNHRLTAAAKSSALALALAAWVAAIIAGISAGVVIAAYFRRATV